MASYEWKKIASGTDAKSLTTISRYDSDFAPGEQGRLTITFPNDSFANIAQPIVDKIGAVLGSDAKYYTSENNLIIEFKQTHDVGIYGVLAAIVAVLVVVVLAVKIIGWVLDKLVELADKAAKAAEDAWDRFMEWLKKHPESIIILTTLLAGGALILSASDDSGRGGVVIVNEKD